MKIEGHLLNIRNSKRVIIEYSKKFPEMLDNSSFGLAEDYNLQRYPIFGGFKNGILKMILEAI